MQQIEQQCIYQVMDAGMGITYVEDKSFIDKNEAIAYAKKIWVERGKFGKPIININYRLPVDYSDVE